MKIEDKIWNKIFLERNIFKTDFIIDNMYTIIYSFILIF